MIVSKKVLLIEPVWCLLFLMAYVIAFYVFFKTKGNIALAVFTLLSSMIGSVAIVYWYHGIPFS
tara:strand:+ start:943 stop:1134 length:192 start_codon:yes stop_codon:yes gene_type:complete